MISRGSSRGHETEKLQTLLNKAMEEAGIYSADSHLLIGERCDRSSTHRTAATNESPYRDLGSPPS